VSNLLKIIEEYMVCPCISSLILKSLVFPILKLIRLLQLKCSKCIMELCNSNLGSLTFSYPFQASAGVVP